ncbi:MAG: HAMP domain-containing sensor histidine kinase [bacterium]
MQYSFYIIAFFLFIGSGVYIFSHVQKKKQTQKVKGIFSKEFFVDLKKYRTIIGELNGRIDQLQNSLSIVNLKSHKLERINRELYEEKIELELRLEKLEALTRKKDEMFTMFVHDIKNPAGVIKNLVELLQTYDLTVNEQKDIILSLIKTSDRILCLADEIAKVIASESDFKMDVRESSLKHTINEAYLLNNVKAKKKNQILQISVDDNIDAIEMDSDKIEQVIDNLLSNAIKFSPEGTNINLNAYKKGKDVLVEVIDEGPGLSFDDIQNAFQKGKRLSTTPTNGEHSSGLGLWIVKRIVNEHKGKVWVESIPGIGSKFIFQIPKTQK